MTAKAKGQAWLAKKLGITQQRVSKLLRRDGWRWPKGGWSEKEVKEIKEWQGGLREENNATASGSPVGGSKVGDDAGEELDMTELLKLIKRPDKRIQAAGMIERAAKTRADRELLIGLWVKKDEEEQRDLKKVQAVMAALSNIRLLAISMHGKSIPEMETELEDFARGVVRKFERGDE